MRRRSLRILMLAFMTLWLGVLVPGHQRGLIQMPGGAASCCQQKTTGGHPDKAPADPADNCAICNFVAHLSVPPTIEMSVEPLRYLHDLPVQPGDSLVARAALVPFDGTGPPAIA